MRRTILLDRNASDTVQVSFLLSVRTNDDALRPGFYVDDLALETND